MAIKSSLLSTNTSPVYTSSGSTVAMTFYMANYSANTPATFSIWAVTSGTAQPTNANVLYSNVTVLPGDTYLASTERLFLDNGDSLWVYCNANSAMSTTLTYTSV